MKVLHVTPQLFRAGLMGGGERYVVELVAAQQKSARVSSSILECWGYGNATLTSPSGTVSVKGIRDISDVFLAHEVVHVHQMNSWGMDFAMVSRLRGSRTVLTDHGGGFRSLGRALGKVRHRSVDAFALVSEWSARDLGVATTDERVSVVRGGGDHVLRGMSSQTLSQVDFLYVGRILPHKGLHVAVESLPSGSSLRVAGEFRDIEYEKYVKMLCTRQNVEFFGPADDNELATLYKSARYTLMPSVERFKAKTYKRPELLGLVALESLACGTPVIGSDVGGLGQLLKWAGQRQVTAGAVPEWAAVLSDAARRAPVPIPSLEDYTWDAVADRTVSTYEQIYPPAGE